MEQLKRNLKIFILFSTFALKSTFQARLGIIFFIAGKILRFFFFFFFIFLILSKTKVVTGYNFTQAAIFYLTFNLIDTASQILFREVYRFRDYVVSGDLDLILTRPFHPFLKVLLGGVDFLDLFLLFPYLAITFFFAAKLPHITFQSSAFYLLLVLNSLLIATGFHILVLALGILTTNVDHTMMIYRDLSTMGRFPFEIYKEPIRGFFTFIIPIGIMMSFPPKALFQLLSPGFYLLSFLLSLVIIFLSLRLWDYALKQYQSWGG